MPACTLEDVRLEALLQHVYVFLFWVKDGYGKSCLLSYCFTTHGIVMKLSSMVVVLVSKYYQDKAHFT